MQVVVVLRSFRAAVIPPMPHRQCCARRRPGFFWDCAGNESAPWRLGGHGHRQLLSRGSRALPRPRVDVGGCGHRAPLAPARRRICGARRGACSRGGAADADFAHIDATTTAAAAKPDRAALKRIVRRIVPRPPSRSRSTHRTNGHVTAVTHKYRRHRPPDFAIAMARNCRAKRGEGGSSGGLGGGRAGRRRLVRAGVADCQLWGQAALAAVNFRPARIRACRHQDELLNLGPVYCAGWTIGLARGWPHNAVHVRPSHSRLRILRYGAHVRGAAADLAPLTQGPLRQPSPPGGGSLPDI